MIHTSVVKSNLLLMYSTQRPPQEVAGLKGLNQRNISRKSLCWSIWVFGGPPYGRRVLSSTTSEPTRTNILEICHGTWVCTPGSCQSEKIEVICSDCELPEDLSHLISKTSHGAAAQGAFGDVWKCSLSYESRNVKVCSSKFWHTAPYDENKVDVAVKVLRILPYDENSMKVCRF